MLQDTVLVGGFAFLLSGGLVWVLLDKVKKSSWNDRSKRLANYVLIGFLIAVAVIVIDWHSTNYKASHASTLPLAPLYLTNVATA